MYVKVSDFRGLYKGYGINQPMQLKKKKSNWKPVAANVCALYIRLPPQAASTDIKG